MIHTDRSAPSTLISADSLRKEIIAFVREHADATIRRFLPDLHWPHYFAGYSVAGNDVWALSHLAASLHGLGVRELAGHTTQQIIAAAMRQVDGKAAEHFASFNIAESLLPFGPFHDNAIIRGFTEAQRANLIESVDSTGIYDPQTQQLRGWLNNFWAVLARCELRRQELGLLEDESVLNQAVAKVRELLAHNSLGFFDDSRTLTGRYDIYSADALLFLHPLWSMLDPAVVGVEGPGSDYVPWFRGPGVLENPVDSPMLCGVPRIFHDGIDYTSCGLPTLVEKHPAGLRLIYDGFRNAEPGENRLLPGRREVTYAINGPRLTAHERWSFETIPAAISLDIVEAARPLTLDVHCATPHLVSTVAVEGMQAWRSFWSELRHLHQVRFTPDREIAFSYTLTVGG